MHTYLYVCVYMYVYVCIMLEIVPSIVDVRHKREVPEPMLLYKLPWTSNHQRMRERATRRVRFWCVCDVEKC